MHLSFICKTNLQAGTSDGRLRKPNHLGYRDLTSRVFGVCHISTARLKILPNKSSLAAPGRPEISSWDSTKLS